MPGEAAFSQYGTGTNILLPCLFPPFPSSHSQSATHFAHLLKFTRFLHELSQPRNLQKKYSNKSSNSKKKCRFHGGLEIWIYSGKWLNSPRNTRQDTRFCIQVSGKGQRPATAAASLQEQMGRVPWNLCWMKASWVTQRLARYSLAKTTQELFSSKHGKHTATQGG